MFINYEMATIEITKAEAKEAGVFKSEMYENLKEAREATGYKVVVKDTKKKADTMKGLTYASNQDHPMTDEQHAVREQILKNFIIPEKYNLLIINASCATSIKIKSRVDYIIINSSHEDTQIQVRGRYTGDLDIASPGNKDQNISLYLHVHFPSSSTGTYCQQ